MQSRIERIHQDQALLRKQARKQFAKRAAVGFFRFVTLGQILREQVAAVFRQKVFRFPGQSFSRGTQQNPSYGLSFFIPVRQLEARQFPRIKPACVAHLFEVVVLGGHPENRHGVDSIPGQLLRNPDCRQRLVHGIRRPAKQSHLLSRDNGNRSLCQPFEIRLRLGTGSQVHVLLAKNPRYFRPAFLGVIEFPAGFRHRLHRRRMGVERLYFFKLLQIGEKQLGLVGELTEGQRATIHVRLDELHVKRSHGFRTNSRPRARDKCPKPGPDSRPT